MSLFKIISKNGETVRYEGKPRYIGTYLKPSYIEFTEIASSAPIEWEVGDYVDYPRTDMRYRLYSIPQASKNAQKDSHGRAFTYSNVQLFAATKELEIVPFRDFVSNDNLIHFSTSPDVTTFENVEGIARRIQACMDDLYPDRWIIRLATFIPGSDSDILEKINTAKDFALSGGTCLDALSKIYELWQEIGWIHSHEDGKEVITIGYANKKRNDNVTDPFLYGKGNGLTAIKTHHTNKDEFATRLYVYGSERNLPSRYYNDKAIANAESVDIRNLMIPIESWGKTNGLPDARKAYLENALAVEKYGVIPRTHYFDSDEAGADIYPTIEGMTVAKVRSALSTLREEKFFPNEEIYIYPTERVDEIKSAANPADDGVLNRLGRAWDQIAYFSYGEELVSTPIKVEEQSKTLNVFVLASKQFDYSKGKGTFKTFETVTGSLIDGGRIKKATLVVELTDSLTKSNTFSERREIVLPEPVEGVRDFVIPKVLSAKFSLDYPVTLYVIAYINVEFNEPAAEEFVCDYYINSGNSTLEVKKELTKNFNITLKQIGFDISERAAQGEKKAISMKSGMCEGRTFNILSCLYDSENDTWDIECARQQDDTLGMLFPNSDYPVASGDSFVLLNISMPETYVLTAEERLEEEGRKLLKKASKYQCNYEPQIDAKLMTESERKLREGMYMEITDEDVLEMQTEHILIDTLTIYEDESAIPTYRVTLKEKRKVSYKGTPSATSPTSTKSAEDISASDIDLSDYATKDYVKNEIAQSGGSGGGSGGGSIDISDWFELDEDTNMIKANYGLYSVGPLVAGGKVDGKEFPNAVNRLEKLKDVKITDPKDGQALVYKDGVWKNSSSAGGGTGAGAALETDIVAGVAVGFITKTTTLYAGMTFTDFVEMMFSQGVKTFAPTVSLAGVPSQAIEVGTEVTLNITSSFKDGYFVGTDKGTTEAGCQPGTASFSLNNQSVEIPYLFVASSPKEHTIQVRQPYGASTVAPVKGGVELQDSIPAGTADASATFVVGYRAFWGYMTDEEAENLTSDLVRGLEHKDTIINPEQKTITLLNTENTIPAGEDLVIALPEGYRLKEIIDTNDFNIADGFIEQSLVVKCAGDITKTYTIFRYDNSSAYPMDIKKITIEEA